MAIHHLTPPIRGGERPRLPSSQAGGVLRPHRETVHNLHASGGGPVTQAIRAMRAAEPIIPVWNNAAGSPDPERQRIRDLRRRIAERIEADIALLDALDGDCDLEDGHDAEGLTDDNGLGDYDALGEQGFSGYGRCL